MERTNRHTSVVEEIHATHIHRGLPRVVVGKFNPVHDVGLTQLGGEFALGDDFLRREIRKGQRAVFFGPAGRTGRAHWCVGDFHLLLTSRNAIDLPSFELLATARTTYTDAIGIFGATQ